MPVRDNILEAIGLPMEKPLCIMSNTESAIALVTRGEASHKGSKHFNVKFHTTQDHVERNKIEVMFCPTTDQIADGLTKPLTRERFVFMKNSFSLIPTSVVLPN